MTTIGVALSEALLEGRDLHYSYAQRSPEALNGASIKLERGTLSALIGANGSGKSSLVRVLCGLLEPSTGEVFLEGRPMRAIEARRRARRIAYVPQSHRTVFPFTALEVVLSGRSPYTPRFRFENARDQAVAREALAAIDGLALATRPVTELSGGERQLVSVARALAQEPECLLLDEPSSALDLKHRAGLMRHLRRLRDVKGITTLIVTHDLMLLDSVFDRVFAMAAGAVVASGTPRDVLGSEVLREIYGDPSIRSEQLFGRTFVWPEI